MSQPRVLFLGDSPTVTTGFGKCTKAVCDYLHEQDWDVHVLGINAYGDPHDFPYPIYPCFNPTDGGHDAFGTSRISRIVAKVEPDIVVILQDPWNIPAYIQNLLAYAAKREEMGQPVRLPPVVGWMAVDSENQKGEQCNGLAHVVTWTKFAADELVRGGYQGSPSIVPLGVDTEVFQPKDRAESRDKVLPPIIPRDGFVVGVVGRNQPRKRLDLTLSGFKRWVDEESIKDAYLFIHTAPTGERGCDLRAMVKYHGLAGRVVLSETQAGYGVDEALMPYVYSAFDVYLTTTQGEGWGLCALEAMACGVPVIAPDWSGLGCWAAPAARLVPCSSTSLTAPANGNPYTVGGVIDEQALTEALSDLYLDEGLRERHGYAGLGLASTLTWERTGREMHEVLASIVAEISESRESA